MLTVIMALGTRLLVAVSLSGQSQTPTENGKIYGVLLLNWTVRD